MTIHLLPPEVASQIAAGEVVERPASVVKELLENALDAGATFISITIEGAGLRLIEIADDGAGIPASELPLAVERHATSKLRSAEDLFHIQTLGFRGEALASIGSVSRLTITSHPPQEASAARLRVDAGRAGQVEPAGAPAGTLIRVEELFSNVPARLKFMKADATERRQIDDLVTRYALAYPHVRFHLRQESRSALQTSGNGSRREVLAHLYGPDVARQMLEVISEGDGIAIQGFISPTSLTRASRREITFFVNGRPVQDSALIAALLKAYHTLLMVGRYPLAVLFVEIDPERVDVNVHPAKAEVRFREPDRVFSEVQRAVRRALLAHTPIPGVGDTLRWSPGSTSASSPALTGLDWDSVGEDEASPTGSEAPNPMDLRWLTEQQGSPTHSSSAVNGQSIQESTPSQAALPGARIPLLRLVGQIASAYLVAEGPDGLYLVDQHAAHERVLFERFMAAHTSQAAGQALLQPVVVELPSAGARLVNDQLPLLAHLGFQVEGFGPNSFLVRAVPVLLKGIDPAAALRVLVEDFEEDETPLQAEQEARIIARVCKRAAVKAGQTLSPEEQRALLADLENCQSPRTCPHGRPTMIHLSVDLLERQFGRKGAR